MLENTPYPSPVAAEEERKHLYRAVLSLGSVEECEKFFHDLCSVSELDSLASRWHMARELNRGRTYLQVSRITRSSTTTVTRAAHWMKHGAGGFRMVLDRLAGKRPRGARKRKVVSISREKALENRV